MIKQTDNAFKSSNNGSHDHTGSSHSNYEIKPPSPLTNQTNRLFLAEGEILRFDRVMRYDMGFYQCIASNGIPPSVSQRIFLPVSCK